MRSKFAIAGHPLHPMLIALPIGLFAWALTSDIIYLATDKDKMWYDISFWSGIAAIITALTAALPGFGDYLTMALRTDARDIATYHMLLNLTVVALYFIAMLFMLDAGALNGTDFAIVIILHAVGTGLLVISGWLGGEMVYRHHLGMVPDNRELERAEETQHRHAA